MRTDNVVKILAWIGIITLAGCSSGGSSQGDDSSNQAGSSGNAGDTSSDGGAGEAGSNHGNGGFSGGSGGNGGSNDNGGSGGNGGSNDDGGSGGNGGSNDNGGSGGNGGSNDNGGASGNGGTATDGGAGGSAGSGGGSCTPLTTQCASTTQVQTCGQDSEWGPATACEFACVAGSCGGECVPGATDCASPTEQEVCSATGQWQAGEVCDYVCSVGACTGQCVPGDRQCDDLTRQQCSDLGVWTDDGAPCQYACDAGSCTGTCTPTDTQCVSTTEIQTCETDSTWGPSTDCPFACVGDSCGGVCVPGTAECVTGLAHRECNSVGQWGSSTQCSVACVGAGQCGECVPASRACFDNAPNECDSNGTWQPEATCAGGTSECSGGQCRAPATWTQLDAGGGHTCALRADGTLWCWGSGSSGQLGDASGATSRTTPVQVLAAGQGTGGTKWNDWTQVSAGSNYTCGIRTNGTLWCWGTATFGQLGHGGTNGLSVPLQVVAAGEPIGGATWNDWTQVSAGNFTTCGLRSNGTAWCWGNGSEGRRGDGTTDQTRATPVQVLAAGESAGGTAWSDWIQVSVGDGHVCGLRTGGTLWCWGGDTSGQRGDGTTMKPAQTTPVQVLAAGESAGGATWSDWTEVAAGYYLTCGLRSNGTAWCWGDGVYGRRGDATTATARNTPIQILQAGAAAGGATWSDWTKIVTGAGSYDVCGLRSNGTLWCWGFGNWGQRGDGTIDDIRTTPIQVLQADATAGGATWNDWTFASTGVAHTCALRMDSSLWCWGRGNLGQRGDGTTADYRTTPLRVISP